MRWFTSWDRRCVWADLGCFLDPPRSLVRLVCDLECIQGGLEDKPIFVASPRSFVAQTRAGWSMMTDVPRIEGWGAFLEPAPSTVFQLGIEDLKAVGVGQRHQEVAARIADQAFDLSLLVGTPDQAEV